MPETIRLNDLFRLSSSLHHDRAVAIRVLIDGYDEISATRKTNSRRKGNGHKPRTPEEGLVQMSFYWASERWEKDQESICPTLEPRYVPDRDDLLIRFIKNLVHKSLDHRSIYCAVGVGCFVYDYQPSQVSALSEDVFKSENVRRVKSYWPPVIRKRFTGACGLATGSGEIPLMVANERQRALIEKSLSVLAPWSSCADIAICRHLGSLLETYFDGSPRISEWERTHVLVDPTCGGYARLVHERNSVFGRESGMRLEDPDNKLSAPKFVDYSDEARPNGKEPLDVERRFDPSPLTDSELATIRYLVERNKHRRASYRSGPLRVVVDGEVRATFRPGFCIKPFTVPTTASWVEVFGEDHLGDLLLAAFPLAHHDSPADGAQVMISIEEKRESTSEFSLSSTLRRTNKSAVSQFFNSFRNYLTDERSKRTGPPPATEETNVVTPWYHVDDKEDDWECNEVVRVLMKKSSVLLERGQLHRALELVRKVIVLDSNFWPARLRCGALLVETGALAKGFEHYAHILEHQKGNAVASAAAYHNQATELERRFGFRRPGTVNEQIAENYELALKLDPQRVMTCAPLVCAYQRLGEIKKAKNLFRESLKFKDAFIRALWEELEMSLDRHKLIPAILSWTKNPQWLRVVNA